MCDTFVALPAQTKNNNLIFGKNSDREPNEAQAIVKIPRILHDKKFLRATFITIDQVPETNAMILSKPYQMWGAEMGVNEHGLVIGNEATFTKVKFNKNNQGLTGMDLLRLALERTKTADLALAKIIELLEQYGQDVCGGYQNKDFYYHNSFLIADTQSAFVLDTVGKMWAYQRVEKYKSISNGLNIGQEYDQISSDAIAYATKKGWHKKGRTFNFQQSFADPLMVWASSCQIRQTNATQQATAQKLDAKAAMRVLSSHHLSDADFAPHKSSTKDLCMHASGLLNPSHTVGSMVAEIRPEVSKSTIWLTGTANPCLSVYKPFFMDGQTLDSVKHPDVQPNGSLWWEAEKLNRFGTRNYVQLKTIVGEDNQILQEKLLNKEEEIIGQGADIEALDRFSSESLAASTKLLDSQLKKAENYSWKRNYLDPIYALRYTKLV